MERHSTPRRRETRLLNNAGCTEPTPAWIYVPKILAHICLAVHSAPKLFNELQPVYVPMTLMYRRLTDLCLLSRPRDDVSVPSIRLS